MLKQEKMSKKKLIFYTAIIVAMFFATGFMIYKNYKLTAVDNSKGFINSSEIGILSEDDFKAEGMGAETGNVGTSSAAELDIFNDQRFVSLKRNLLKKVNLIVGKEDPFEIRDIK